MVIVDSFEFRKDSSIAFPGVLKRMGHAAATVGINVEAVILCRGMRRVTQSHITF